ncbi:MAG: alpha/beta fold hydrolase [Candidatus Eremiobacteraeota bacterium]|nr:alpha/beta fold hydrolase [Candidatus Eremiobacteraeota bacterium]MCW5872560.1 alpha/beta fold hydrolase [Candidatus Eremiobacteraeota bacterium]
MKIYHEDHPGPGTPLLLIAGLASDAVSYTFQVEPLNQHHRLLLCDNRGVGRSPKPPGPYTIEQMAQDILEFLPEEKVHILGHSMGGAIAQHLAAHHPERIGKLILACTQQRFQGRTMAIVESWAGLLKYNPEAALLGRSLFPWLYTQDFLDQPGNLQACIDALQAHPYRLEADAIAAQVAALKTFQPLAIKVPTLVLAADQDLLTTPANARQLYQSIPGSHFKVLENTGHSCMLQTPQAFNQAVLEYLNTSAG